MNLIVAGGRKFTDRALVISTLNLIERRSGMKLIIVSGCANGADSFGEFWAKQYERKIIPFPANWDKYGNDAGHIRNMDMAMYAEALLAFWDGVSTGTKDMINQAIDNNLYVKVIRY